MARDAQIWRPDAAFHTAALETFRFQYLHNPVYNEYVNLLGVAADGVSHPEQIPFLPVSFFKTHHVYAGSRDPEITFLSSGTTTAAPSRHPVASLEGYEESFTRGFEQFYGNPQDWCFLCLLPGYLERPDSSLIYMAKRLIQTSRYPESGFYLRNLGELADRLQQCIQQRIPTLLLGVSYALLDLAEQHPANLEQVIVMETGGMKGERPELSKSELHGLLKQAFQVSQIHSEYGMTELLSQAWSDGDGKFRTPPWMEILIRDPYDPFTFNPSGASGGINIIDLANRYSCSFIQTDDLGRKNPDGSFEVLGRLPNSDIRGCNLLLE